MRITEKLLWLYIDGECTQRQRDAIEAAMDADASLKAELERLLALHRKCAGFFRSTVAEAVNTPRQAIRVDRGNRLNCVIARPEAVVIDLYSRARLNCSALIAAVATYATYLYLSALAF